MNLEGKCNFGVPFKKANRQGRIFNHALGFKGLDP